MSVCNICCEPYSSLVRKKKECYLCNFECCLKCVKTYILEVNDNVKCMNCREPWSREFLYQILPVSWMTKQYRSHLENILFNKEVAKLPSTMYAVEEELERRKRHVQLRQLRIELDELKQKQFDLESNISRLVYGQIVVNPNSRKYQSVCPNSNCRGFIESGCCIICKTVVCQLCLFINPTIDHQCKPDDLKTVQLLSMDTKMCPNMGCQAPIYKINGCSQMFCTQCKTAFDWNTMKIYNNHNHFHNPHYFEWLNENIAANRHIHGDHNIYINHIKDIANGKPLKSIICKFSAFYRYMNHVIHTKLNFGEVDITEQRKQNLRVNYILKDISEDAWKCELQKIEKRKDLEESLRLKNTILVNDMQTLLNQLINCVDIDSYETLLNNESEKIRNDFNTSITTLYNLYGKKPIIISEVWF